MSVGRRPEESEELLHSPGVLKCFKQNKERKAWGDAKSCVCCNSFHSAIISEEKIGNVGQKEEQKILSHLVAATEKLEYLKEHGRSKGERWAWAAVYPKKHCQHDQNLGSKGRFEATSRYNSGKKGGNCVNEWIWHKKGKCEPAKVVLQQRISGKFPSSNRRRKMWPLTWKYGKIAWDWVGPAGEQLQFSGFDVPC